MPYGGDAHGLAVVDHLVDHPVRADPQGPEPAKPAPELVTGFRISFQHAERVRDRLADHPVQLENLGLGTTGKDDARHQAYRAFCCVASSITKVAAPSSTSAMFAYRLSTATCGRPFSTSRSGRRIT